MMDIILLVGFIGFIILCFLLFIYTVVSILEFIDYKKFKKFKKENPTKNLCVVCKYYHNVLKNCTNDSNIEEKINYQTGEITRYFLTQHFNCNGTCSLFEFRSNYLKYNKIFKYL